MLKININNKRNLLFTVILLICSLSNTVVSGQNIERNSTRFQQPEVLELAQFSYLSKDESYGYIPYVSEPKRRAENASNTFKALESDGVIGIESKTEKENPSDNFFTVELPDDVDLSNYDVVLKYNLFGLEGAGQTTKSVNNSAVYGGQSIKINDTWNEVVEYLPSEFVKSGKNEIFFNRRSDETYQYKVKDLSIDLVDKRSNNIFLTSNYLISYSGNIHMVGFVPKGVKKVSVLNETVPTKDGMFEYVLTGVDASLNNLSISYVNGDVKHISEEYSIEYLSDEVSYDFSESVNANNNLMSADLVSEYIVIHELKEGEDVTTIPSGIQIEGLDFKELRPLNSNVENVTSSTYLGFRTTSIAKNNNGELKLHLKFDESKIPAGYSAKDVRTFAFDQEKREWTMLRVDSLNYENKMVISTFKGDTDYINGIIKVPEMAETASFTPTTISDMKYANPTAGVVSIPPPSPSNTGAATTSFPIKLPAGRNGMAPSLGVNYNSEGGNSWMGVGWDMQLPAITLDTRWGVPRFSSSQETEIYQLNGETLVMKVGNEYTNPHRNETNISRTGNRVFYLRKEGGYLKITRYGYSPTSYRWEVIDKFGNKSLYGGTSSGVVNNAVIRDASSTTGNITHWALYQTEDPFGNYVRYNYSKGTVNVSEVNNVSTQYFYPNWIKYTLKSGASSPNYYQVDFVRNDHTVGAPGTETREDIMLNARTGTLMSTKDLLTEVKVSFYSGQLELIRSYRFDYTVSAFKKTQLSKISEYDGAGLLFYSNTMDYYDEVGTGSIINNNETVNWNGGSSSIVSPLSILAPGGFLVPDGSILGTSTTSGFSVGLRVGVGIGFNAQNVATTFGGSYNYSQSKLKSKISFLDINGDGLPDKVYKPSSGNIKYMPNLGIDNSNSGIFGSIREIGLDELDNSKSRTNSFGADVNLLGLVGGGKSFSKTRTTTDGYFTDYNGDGLPDYVGNGQIKFNTTSPWQNANSPDISFTNNVNDTENPIESGIISNALINNLELETREELRAEHPQFDHIKAWKAPYTGTISIVGSALLLNENNCNSSLESNDFRAWVEYATEGQTTGLTDVVPNSTKNLSVGIPATYSLNWNVTKGDQLFFRIHNRTYGCGGEVEWNPTITYNSVANIPSLTDEHGKNYKQFNVEEDYIVNNGGGWSPSNNDTGINDLDFNLNNSTFDLYQFSDFITFTIEKLRYEHSTETVTGAGGIIIVSDGEIIDSTVYTRSITYDPNTGNFLSPVGASITQMKNIEDQYTNGGMYSYVYRFHASSNSNVQWDDINWQPTISNQANDQYYPTITYSTYDRNVNQSNYQVYGTSFPSFSNSIDDDDPVIRVSHNMFAPGLFEEFLYDIEVEDSIQINWVVKERIGTTTKLLHNKKFYLYKLYCFNLPWTSPMCAYTIKTPNGDVIDPSNAIYNPYFQFNLTKEKAEEIKNGSGKVYSAFYIDNSTFGDANPTDISISLVPGIIGSYSAVLDKPFFAKDYTYYGITYRGWGHFLYNGGIRFEYNDEGYIIGGPETFDGRIDMSVFDYNENPDGVQNQLDNPDDIDINEVSVRYSFYNQNNENGSYTNLAIKNNETSSVLYGFNGGQLTSTLGRFGEYNIYDLWIDPATLNIGGVFVGLKQRSESTGKSTSGNVSVGPLGASGTKSEGNSRVLNQYVDLNGDRYPDIVTESKIQYTNMVGALSSSAQDYIDNNFVAGGKSTDGTVGVTISGVFPNSTESDNGSNTKTNINSGVNTSSGESFNSRQWNDINGDGLTDKVTINRDDVRVQLNTGYEFSSEIVWGTGYGNLDVSKRNNIGLSGGFGNASYAFGFGAGGSTARLNAALIDVNGDGLPDLVVNTGAGYRFYLNTGSKFETYPTQVFHNSTIDKDYSVSGNIYGSFTTGFTIVIPFIPPIPIKFTFTPTVGVNAGVNEKQITIQDIDGDGLVDVIQGGSNNGSLTAKLNKVGKTNYLKSVNTPLGGSWTVDYNREGNTFDMPHNKWVLNNVVSHDGFEGDNAYGPDQALVTFEYEMPKYDRREREFLGFGKVKVNQKNPIDESTYRYSITEYHNDNIYLKGLVKHTSSLDNGDNVLNESLTLYNIMDPESPETNLVDPENNLYLQTSLDWTLLDKSRLFTAPVKTVSTIHENGNSLSTEQQFTDYDIKGNLLSYKNLGDTYTIGSINDAFETRMEYYDNIPSVGNSTGFVKNISVLRQSDGEVMRYREAEYNLGKMSKIKIKLNDTQTNVMTMGYDTYGNLLSTDLANGYNTTFTYDNIVKSYPVSITNTHGYTSSTIYDYLFGVPVLVTDINGQRMRTRIDNRGRIVEVTAPNEITNSIPATSNEWTLRMQYQSESNSPPTFNGGNYVVPAIGSFEAINPSSSQPTNAKHHAVTRHNVVDAQGGQLLTVSLVDGTGSEIQLKKTLYANSNGSSPLRWLISGKEKKDAFGRVIESYLPTTQTGYPTNLNFLPSSVFAYQSGSNSIPPVLASYDSRDRNLSVTQPGESQSTNFTYDIDAGMFSTTSTNELDQTFTTYSDVRGRKRKTIQNGELTTQFYYNTIGEKIKVKNHQGYETLYKYDLAGRRLEERHPDRGLSINEYDVVGNIVKRYTSNLLSGEFPEVITYGYSFNQLVSVNYSQHPENNVKYTYGTPNIMDPVDAADAVARNSIGRLYLQEDASGVQGFGYDNLGNLNKHLRGVAVAGRHTFWYYTSWTYDSHNRIKVINYPDQERVNYNYNPGGTLNSVTRTIFGLTSNDLIISNIRYNNLGERTQINYGNGTNTAYTYDNRRRLQNLSHQFSGFGLTNKYTYDVIGNVKSVITQSPGSSIPGTGQLGGPVSHNYEYDDYNRLVQADGRYTGPNDYGTSLLAQEYSLDMEYDLAHNIISKSQTHVQGSVSSHSSAIGTPEVMPKTNYHLNYGGYAAGANIIPELGSGGEYGYVQPHAPREIIETPDNGSVESNDPRYKKKMIEYDANGNQVKVMEIVYDDAQPAAYEGIVEPDSITLHRNLWDDEDRLRAVDLNPDEDKAHPLAVYTYDAGGQRIVRYVPGRLDAWSNGGNVSSNERDEVVMYPSPLVTAKALSEFGVPPTQDDLISSYTKHYYIGSERISSTLGTVPNLGLYPPKIEGLFPTIRGLANQSVQEANIGLLKTYDELDQDISLSSPVFEGNLQRFEHTSDNFDVYWYHRDHLGSSSYISNEAGIVSQHMEYLPFGESLVDEHLNSYNTPYKFNGKELDDETGNYYYGARYYNPKFSTWLSVDPLKEKYPSISSYAYVAQNPLKYVDPDGRQIIGVNKDQAKRVHNNLDKVFAAKKFDALRALFTRGKKNNKSKFDKIDKGDLDEALSGLKGEDLYLAEIVTGAINSDDKHKVEFLEFGAYASGDGSKAAQNHVKNNVDFIDKLPENEKGRVLGSKILELGGKYNGGLNVPTEDGSHSFLGQFSDSVEMFHEVFGHGIPSAKKSSNLVNSTNAIRLENLVHRVMGNPNLQRTGHTNQTVKKPKSLPMKR